MKINNSTSNNYLRVLGKSRTIINETFGGSNTPADSSVFENYSSTYLNQSKIDQLRLNVPQEIQNSSKFCPVKTPVYRDDNGRLQIRKTPCDLTGKAVSGYKSCLAFDEVAIPNKKVNAISMVLPEKCEGYAVIDIDDCIVNGKLDPTHPRFDVIDELLKTLDTYFEISMSGKGLHGIIGVYGGKPEFITRTRNDYFELYFEKRVIILTGNLLLGKSSKIQWLSLEKMKNVYDLIGLNTKPISKIMTSSKPQNVQNRVYELSDSKNVDDVLANLRKYPLSAELLDGDWRNTRYPKMNRTRSIPAGSMCSDILMKGFWRRK